MSTYAASLCALAVVSMGCSSGVSADQLQGHTDNVYWIGITSKGDIAVSAGRDTAIVWDLPARRQLRSFGKGWCSGALIPHSTLVCTGDERGNIVIWDHGTSAEVAKLSVPGMAKCLAASPDGKFLAAGIGYPSGGSAKQAEYDYGIRIWNITTPASPVALTNLTGHKGQVNGLAFSPTSDVLFSGSWDGTVRSWEFQKGTQRHQNGESVNALLVAGPDNLYGTRNLIVSNDGRLALNNKVFASDGLKLLLKIDEDPFDGASIVVLFDADPARLWVGSATGYLLAYDLATGKPTKRQRVKDHNGQLLTLALTPDGKEILVGGRAAIPAFSAADRNVPRTDPSIKIYRMEALR